MAKRSFPVYSLMLVVIGIAPAVAQLGPEMIRRGKRATALVEVARADSGADRLGLLRR